MGRTDGGDVVCTSPSHPSTSKASLVKSLKGRMQSNTESHRGGRVPLGVAFWRLSPLAASRFKTIDWRERHSTEVGQVTKGRLLRKCVDASSPRLLVICVPHVHFHTNKVFVGIKEGSDGEDKFLGSCNGHPQLLWLEEIFDLCNVLRNDLLVEDFQQGGAETKGAHSTAAGGLENRHCLNSQPDWVEPFWEISLKVGEPKLLQQDHVLLLHAFAQHTEKFGSHTSTARCRSWQQGFEPITQPPEVLNRLALGHLVWKWPPPGWIFCRHLGKDGWIVHTCNTMAGDP